MVKQKLTLAGRIKSFQYGFNGIYIMLQSQQNAWIHAAATFIVFAAGVWLRFSKNEWCWIMLAIVAVWTAEALNTAFEFLADAASPGYHPLVKNAKDVAAGAVLIAAIGALVIAVLIFMPHILLLFNR